MATIAHGWRRLAGPSSTLMAPTVAFPTVESRRIAELVTRSTAGTSAAPPVIAVGNVRERAIVCRRSRWCRGGGLLLAAEVQYAGP